jgi:hypothetical protein
MCSQSIYATDTNRLQVIRALLVSIHRRYGQDWKFVY